MGRWEVESGESPQVWRPANLEYTVAMKSCLKQVVDKDWHLRLSPFIHSCHSMHTPKHILTLTYKMAQIEHSVTQINTLTFTHTRVLTHIYTHTYTSHSHFHTHSLFHTHTLTFTYTHSFTLWNTHIHTMVQRDYTVTPTLTHTLMWQCRQSTQSYLGRSKMLQQYSEIFPEELCNETI